MCLVPGKQLLTPNRPDLEFIRDRLVLPTSLGLEDETDFYAPPLLRGFFCGSAPALCKNPVPCLVWNPNFIFSAGPDLQRRQTLPALEVCRHQPLVWRTLFPLTAVKTPRAPKLSKICPSDCFEGSSQRDWSLSKI